MAIAVTNLVSTGTATDAVSYNLPSANIDANVLVLVGINVSAGGVPTSPTITGLTGATWATLDECTFNTQASPNNRLGIYRTMVGTSQNTVTITASFGGGTMNGFAGFIELVSGVSTGGTNGSAAVQQSTFFVSTGGSGTNTITVTLASSPTNAVYGQFGKSVNTAMGVPSGFTSLVDEGAATPAKRVMAAWNLTPTQSITSTQPANAQLAGIAVEFVPQTTSTGGGATPFFRRRTLMGVGV